MIKSLYNTNVLTAAQMLDVSDESIIAMSNGEVTKCEDIDDDDNLITNKPTLLSEEIFGKIGEKNLKMGHIHLPVPIVNIQYYRGKKPILPSVLKMDRKTVEGIIHNHVFLEKETDKLVTGKKNLPSNSSDFITGAEAIKYLLDKAGYPSEHIILNNIPVIPLGLRAKKDKNGRVFFNHLERLYTSVLLRSSRYAQLISLNVPDIIVQNERESLQVYADRLICNGATTSVATSFDGSPADSLQDIANLISDINYKPIDRNAIISKYSKLDDCSLLLNACKKYVELNLKDYDSAGTDTDKDSYVVVPKEDVDALHALLKEVYRYSDLIAEGIFEDHFGGYDDYEAEFVYSTHVAVNKCVESADSIAEVNSEMLENIIIGMYMQMLYLKKYRVQWIEEDAESYKEDWEA